GIGTTPKEKISRYG
ncbi:hypothetical protein D046_6074B, partial [Vibrio parahaemolyticus V-223/04]